MYNYIPRRWNKSIHLAMSSGVECWEPQKEIIDFLFLRFVMLSHVVPLTSPVALLVWVIHISSRHNSSPFFSMKSGWHMGRTTSNFPSSLATGSDSTTMGTGASLVPCISPKVREPPTIIPPIKSPIVSIICSPVKIKKG